MASDQSSPEQSLVVPESASWDKASLQWSIPDGIALILSDYEPERPGSKRDASVYTELSLLV
jgi:hypothetical protein